MTRKCWNCGEPTDDNDLRVCDDPICGAAAIKQRANLKDAMAEPQKNEYAREYYWRNRERLLEKRKEYDKRPEVKKRRREYQRKYLQRPEVKERRREYQRKWQRERYKRPEVKERRREYLQRPEVKKRRNKLAKERYKRRKQQGK